MKDVNRVSALLSCMRRFSRWLPEIAVIGLFVCLSLLRLQPVPAPYEDQGGYVALGRSLAADKGFVRSDLPGEPVDRRMSPAYPLFIAGLIKVCGDNVLIFQLSSLIIMAAALGIFALVLRCGRVPAGVRHAVMALCAVCPLLLTFSLPVLTEAGFLFLLTAGLYCFLRYERSGHAGWFWTAMGAGMIAFFQRYAGIVLFVAFLGVLPAWKRREKGIITVMLVLCAVWFARGFFQAGTYAREIVAAGNYLNPGAGAISVFGFLKRSAYEVAAYVGDILPDFIFPPLVAIAPHDAWWVLKIAAGVVFTGLIVYGGFRLRGRVSPAVLAVPGLYCAGMPLFPTYAIRYLLPVAPFLILFFTSGVWNVSRNRKVLFMAVVVTLAGGYAYRTINDTADARHGYGRNWAGLQAACAYVRTQTSVDAVVMSRKPRLCYLWSDRQSVGYPYSEKPEDILSVIHDTGVGYVVVDSLEIAGIPFTQKYLVPAIRAYPDRFEEVFQTSDGRAYVYRVRTGEQ